MITKDREYRSFEMRSTSEGAQIIEGYAIVWEVPTVMYHDNYSNEDYMEVIDRHALDNADLSDVVLTVNHQGTPIARTRNGSLQLASDSKGLKITADLSGSEEAQDTYRKVQSGLLDKMSFAFDLTPDGEIYEQGTRTRRISKIKTLYDCAVVTKPAYEQTSVYARSKFESLAEPNRINYRKAEVKSIRAGLNLQIETRLKEQRFGFPYENLMTRSKLAQLLEEDQRKRSYHMQNYGFLPFQETITLDDLLEPIFRDMYDMQKRWERDADSQDVEAAKADLDRLQSLEEEIRSTRTRYNERNTNYSGNNSEHNKEIASFMCQDQTEYRKEDKNMNTELRAIFNNIVEARAAGTTTTMKQVIPQTILDSYVKEGVNSAFLDQAQVTAIAHEGNLSIPIADLQDIDKHEENAQISVNGYIPNMLTIEHAEYCYQTGYSDIGISMSAANMETLVSETILNSMMQKMDRLCVDAVGALKFSDGESAVKVTSSNKPTYADFVTLAGMLGNDYLTSAKWHMSPSTYFKWFLCLQDGQNRPILDTTKQVKDQAFCGYGIVLDCMVPVDTVYFGDAHRIHLNYARNPQLNSWTDYDHNTQKFSVRTVAGAAAEPGCMVKLYAGV